MYYKVVYVIYVFEFLRSLSFGTYYKVVYVIYVFVCIIKFCT